MKGRFRSSDVISRVRSPLLIVHGARDRVVPVTFGRRLFEDAPDPKRMIEIPDGGHNMVLGGDDCAGQQAGGVGGKKQNGRADFLRLAETVHRCLIQPLIQHRVLAGECQQGGVDIGRCHGIDTHTARRPFGGHGAGQMMHPGLGGIVMALLLRPVHDQPRHGADINDRSLAAIEHDLSEAARAAEHTVKIDIDHPQPVRVGHGFDTDSGLCDSGIANQYLDRAARIGQFLRRGVDGRAVGDIHHAGLNLKTLIRKRGLTGRAAFRGYVGHDQIGTGLAKRLGAGQTDPLTGPRHQGGAAFETKFFHIHMF